MGKVQLSNWFGALKPSYIFLGSSRLLFLVFLELQLHFFVYCSALVALRYTGRRLKRDEGVKIRSDTENT